MQSLIHYFLAIGELGQYQAAIDLLLEGRDYGIAADSLYGLLKINNTLGWAYPSGSENGVEPRLAKGQSVGRVDRSAC